jgi:peptidoglycan/xylan/chitin deacetylase (PgdA/CDA1 family)
MRQAADLVLAPSLGSWNFSDVVHSVALTLDDGPDPEVTPALIDLLDQMSVRATFFVLTLRAEDYPQLVDALVSSGHEIALHGLDHRRVSQMNFGQAFESLKNARDRLEQVVGRSVTMYRPPYGSQSVSSVRAARRAGLQVVVWDGDAADWEDRPALDVAAAADQASTPGGILLFHERLEPDPAHPDPIRGAPVTSFDRAEVLADIIGRVRRRGLEPCAVGDLAAQGRMHSTAWLRP